MLTPSVIGEPIEDDAVASAYDSTTFWFIVAALALVAIGLLMARGADS